jgi:hypothetical protein
MKRVSRSCEAAHPAGAFDCSSLRGAIIRALDAHEFGDHRQADAILLAALEDVDVPRRQVCPECGLRFCWPGELDDHLRVSHRIDDLAAA